MGNFKVGDKVKYVSGPATFYTIGQIYEVAVADGSGYVIIDDDGSQHNWTEVAHTRFEKIPSKPTRNQRISALEQQVAELQAEVEALKKAHKSDEDIPSIASKLAKFIEGKAHMPELTPNEKRNAIIAEAKAFVEDAKVDWYGSRLYKVGGYLTDVEFIVNKEKRAVTALLYWHSPMMKRNGEPRELKAKAVAKCAPDDVFNEHIGKAIALGRALGLDVSKFENAVKPTEVIAGMVVTTVPNTEGYRILNGSYKVGYVEDGDAYDSYTGDGEGWVPVRLLRIIDDTEAQY